MVTLKEIAKECDVSATTVSNILNGKPKVSAETRNKVLEIVKKRGYQPNYIAQGLRNQKTRMIGIIAEDIAQFTTPIMIESIMEYCEKMGYRMIVQNLRLYGRWKESWYNNEEAYRSVFEPAMQELKSIKVDGILYVAGHARKVHFLPQDLTLPLVMAYSYSDSPKVSSVVIDDEKGGYDIMKYLLSMGHRKIGIIGGKADNIHTQKRLLGAQKAMFEAQAPYNPEWVCYGDWDRRSGSKCTERLVKAGVSAIFCMADRMAGGVYDYLEKKGLRAGVDISVAGFDNQDLSEYFRPALTTMGLPLSEIGYKSAELLLNMIQNEENAAGDNKTDDSITGAGAAEAAGSRGGKVNEKKEILVPCTMVERDSVKQLKE